MTRREQKLQETNASRMMLVNTFASGRWFQLPREFMAFLPLHSAVILSMLCNVARSVKAEERTGGWFYCKAKRITKETFISENAQTNAFNLLRKLGCLKTRIEGIPARRMIRLEYEIIAKYGMEALANEPDFEDDE